MCTQGTNAIFFVDVNLQYFHKNYEKNSLQSCFPRKFAFVAKCFQKSAGYTYKIKKKNCVEVSVKVRKQKCYNIYEQKEADLYNTF
jgi:hypothetical protein